MTQDHINDIRIRPFAADRDTVRVREIAGEIWHGGTPALMEKQYGMIGGRPWSEWMADAVLDYFRAADARSFVAEKDGRVVGFCSYVIDNARKVGTVGYNGVAKSHQGMGLGSAMMEHVMNGIRSEGMEYAMVLVADNDEHLPARRVYEKCGFRRITGYHEMVQKL